VNGGGNSPRGLSSKSGKTFGKVHTSREWDSEIGQYYYRARNFSAFDGRFVSCDPLTFEAADTNLYRYTKNCPTKATDPTGLTPVDTILDEIEDAKMELARLHDQASAASDELAKIQRQIPPLAAREQRQAARYAESGMGIGQWNRTFVNLYGLYYAERVQQAKIDALNRQMEGLEDWIRVLQRQLRMFPDWSEDYAYAPGKSLTARRSFLS
jgi:RHS repeat-associated protein